jgi:ABC-type sugar transport system ATPase subunit
MPAWACRPRIGKRLGLVLSMNCRENTSLAVARAAGSDSVSHRVGRREIAGQAVLGPAAREDAFDGKRRCAGLSGGNQQKIALAKWLARECSILFVDETDPRCGCWEPRRKSTSCSMSWPARGLRWW